MLYLLLNYSKKINIITLHYINNVFNTFTFFIGSKNVQLKILFKKK